MPPLRIPLADLSVNVVEPRQRQPITTGTSAAIRDRPARRGKTRHVGHPGQHGSRSGVVERPKPARTLRTPVDRIDDFFTQRSQTRSSQQQTAQSRIDVEAHAAVLTRINVHINELLHIWRQFILYGDTKPDLPRAFWDQVEECSDAVLKERDTLQTWRGEGGGQRFHIGKGFFLNLPYAWFHDGLRESICNALATVKMPGTEATTARRQKKCLEELQEELEDLDCYVRLAFMKPSAPTDEVKRWCVEGGYGTDRPPWVLRVME